jgi:hypothetical protein
MGNLADPGDVFMDNTETGRRGKSLSVLIVMGVLCVEIDVLSAEKKDPAQAPSSAPKRPQKRCRMVMPF